MFMGSLFMSDNWGGGRALSLLEPESMHEIVQRRTADPQQFSRLDLDAAGLAHEEGRSHGLRCRAGAHRVVRGDQQRRVVDQLGAHLGDKLVTAEYVGQFVKDVLADPSGG